MRVCSYIGVLLVNRCADGCHRGKQERRKMQDDKKNWKMYCPDKILRREIVWQRSLIREKKSNKKILKGNW